jgi:hypothetical protein
MTVQASQEGVLFKGVVLAMDPELGDPPLSAMEILMSLASSRVACVHLERVMMRLSLARFFGFAGVELPLPIVPILFTACSGSGT